MREPGVSAPDRVDADEAAGVEELGSDHEHRQVDDAGQSQRDEHVQALEAEHALPLGVVPGGHTPIGERRVEVDRVRHHGRADDPDREVEGVVSG